jgi:arginyl-tRNA synthetase
MNEVISLIAAFISKETGLPFADLPSLIEIPRDPQWGDYAFPCFSLAKSLKKSPQILAQNMANNFRPHGLLAQCTPVGGYLNFHINRPAWAEVVLKKILATGRDYGKTKEGAGKKVLIEFSSPNIAKPFHVGHLRSTIIGHALCQIFAQKGYEIIRLNHLGDWGKQFGEVITAFKRWGDIQQLQSEPLKHLLEIYSRFHYEAQKEEALHEEARGWFKRLEEGDAEARALWSQFREISIQEFKRLYSLLGISFDSYEGESFYQDKIPSLIKRLRDQGLLVESEGAWVIPLDAYQMPPALILKSDEASLYLTRDIAAAEYRFQKWQFHKLIYVVGAPQKLHFQQLFKVLELMGYTWSNRLVHVDFGHVLGMSTRRGEVVLLQDVIDEACQRAERIIAERGEEKEARIGKIREEERAHIARAVGLGAIIFNDLRTKRNKDVEFNWERILNFEGATGPYCQNAHVRCASIMRKAPLHVSEQVDYEILTSNEEFDLVKRLGSFPEVIDRAAAEYEPSLIALYMLELAMSFNVFLAKYRVLSENPQSTPARLLLTYGVKEVLASCLSILGMEALERM